MNAPQRKRWRQEDIELEEEFEEVTHAWRESAAPPPRVPGALDRRIKEQARYRVGEQLTQSWLFGSGPQLALAASLLFGIGLFFIVSLENAPPAEDRGLDLDRVVPFSGSPSTEAPARPVVTRTSGWIRLSFDVNEAGKAQNIDVMDRCLRRPGSDRCSKNSTVMDRYAVDIVRMREYEPGRRQDVVVF